MVGTCCWLLAGSLLPVLPAVLAPRSCLSCQASADKNTTLNNTSSTPLPALTPAEECRLPPPSECLPVSLACRRRASGYGLPVCVIVFTIAAGLNDQKLAKCRIINTGVVSLNSFLAVMLRNLRVGIVGRRVHARLLHTVTIPAPPVSFARPLQAALLQTFIDQR